MNALNPKYYVKAIYAALVVAYAMHTAAVSDASHGGETVTLNEWVALAFAVAIAAVGVYTLPNADDNNLPRG